VIEEPASSAPSHPLDHRKAGNQRADKGTS
jgi:hypothetical protein